MDGPKVDGQDNGGSDIANRLETLGTELEETVQQLTIQSQTDRSFPEIPQGYSGDGRLSGETPL